MPDDLELTSPVNDEGAEPEGQLDISPQARSSWDRVLEKRGLTPSEPTGEEDAGAAPAAPQPPRKQAPPAPDTRALPPASGHRVRERNAARRVQEAFQKRLDGIEESLRALLPKPPGIDPEADPEKYTSQLIRQATLEALESDPFMKELREERAAQREAQEAVRQEVEYFNAWGDEMSTWEQEYQRDHPDLFEGYYERLHGFIRASDHSLISLGMPPQQARRETMKGLAGLTQRALEMNVHPVAYVDHLWRQTPDFQGKNGNGAGGEAARRAQAAANRETRERQAAGRAASTLSTTKAPPAPSPAGKMAAAVEDAPQGRGRAAAIAKAARRAGGSAKDNLRQIARPT